MARAFNRDGHWYAHKITVHARTAPTWEGGQETRFWAACRCGFTTAEVGDDRDLNGEINEHLSYVEVR